MSSNENVYCLSRSIKFSSVIELFEKIRETKNARRKEELLKIFLQTFRNFRENAQKTDKDQVNLYLMVIKEL